MSSDYLGDKEVVKQFETLIKAFEEYKKHIDSILEFFGQFLDRLNALVNSTSLTSKTKMKLLSAPSSDEIKANIEETINDMRTQVKKIADIVKEIERISKESKIKCDKCKGEGEVYTLIYDKIDGMVQETLGGETCDKCKGKGYLYLSNTLISHLKKIIETLKLLFEKVSIEEK
ncbi:MAG: hypothetical protein QXY65_06750 [Candidatus Methanomethylicaceae archaeon]